MSNPSAEYTLESGIQALDMRLGQTWWTSQSNPSDIKDLYSDRPLASGPMYVSVIACANWRFTLRQPILIQESYERGIWTQRYEPLGILAFGQSREEATEAFCVEFACCWEEIACEEDDNLTADARELKGRLRSIVKDAKPLE
jgi:hypothetical protein